MGVDQPESGMRGWQAGQPRKMVNTNTGGKRKKMSIVGLSVAIWWC
jgi:hypothetical protein